MRCPKCDFDQDESAVECFKCGLVFSKYEALLKRKDQQNSRYSPQAGGDAAFPVTASLVEEAPPPETAPPGEIQADASAWRLELAEKIEGLHLAIQAASNFQEGLSRQVDAQQVAIGTMFEQFNAFRDEMDQQTLLLQNHVRMFSDQVRQLASGLADQAPWESVRQDLAAVREQLASLSDESSRTHPFHRLVSRLGQLEDTQDQIRRLLAGSGPVPPGGAVDAEMPLLKSEVQALRAEVRGLLAIPSSAGPAQPAVNGQEGRLRQLEDQVRDITQAVSGKLDTVQREKADLREKISSIGDTVQVLETKLAAMTSLAPGVEILSAELASLRQGYQAFTGGVQADLAQQQARLEEREADILRQQREIEETREVIARLRAVFAREPA